MLSEYSCPYGKYLSSYSQLSLANLRRMALGDTVFDDWVLYHCMDEIGNSDLRQDGALIRCSGG
jgi:hypothetical protein